MLQRRLERLQRLSDNPCGEVSDTLWGVLKKLLKKQERRRLVVPAWAYLLLRGLGLHARQHYHPGHWCGNTKAGQCSVFTIGRRVPDFLELTAAQALAAVRTALYSGLENRGWVSYAPACKIPYYCYKYG